MAESRRAIAARRGYLAVTVRQRGPLARGMRAAYNAASTAAWTDAAQYFHDHLRDDRFTPGHALLADYAARKGERLPRDSKAFRRGYYGSKLSSEYGGGRGVANPLVWSGETRQRVATEYRITATSKGGKVAYAGARKLNFKHPKSRIRMSEEFRRVLPIEINTLARVYDQSLDRHLNTESA